MIWANKKKTDSAGSRAQNVWGAFAARALLQKSLITPSSRCWASRVAWQDCVTSPSSICWHLPPIFLLFFRYWQWKATQAIYLNYISILYPSCWECRISRKKKRGAGEDSLHTGAVSISFCVFFLHCHLPATRSLFKWARETGENMSNLRVGMRDDASVPSHPTSMNSFPTLSISCDPQNALVQRFASCALCGCRAVRLLCVYSSSCNTTLSVGGGGGNKELSL